MKKLTWVSAHTWLRCFGSRRQAVQQAPEGALLYNNDANHGGPASLAFARVVNGKAVKVYIPN